MGVQPGFNSLTTLSEKFQVFNLVLDFLRRVEIRGPVPDPFNSIANQVLFPRDVDLAGVDDERRRHPQPPGGVRLRGGDGAPQRHGRCAGSVVHPSLACKR